MNEIGKIGLIAALLTIVASIAHAGELPADAPRTFASAARVRRPPATAWLSQREFDRVTRARVATAERLANGAEGTELEALATSLSAHYRAQKHSSPWAPPARRSPAGPAVRRSLPIDRAWAV